MDSKLAGDPSALELRDYHITLSIKLVGKEGKLVVDYRNDTDLLRQVGTRALISIKGDVVATFASVTKPDAGYDVALVHHDRNNSTLPSRVASVLRQSGALVLTRSQAVVNLSGVVGYASNVGKLILPDPVQGVSPRLVLCWESFGTTDKSEAFLALRFSVEASGNQTPDFD